MIVTTETGENTVLKGIVRRITYRNEQNCYTVATVDAGDESITVVGALPFLNEGDIAEFTGSYTVHPTYGSQFKVVSFERSVPETSAGILRYLSSGVIRGIGPSTAEKIVKKFGDKTLEIIQNDPAQLAGIKGISQAKAFQMSEEYNKQYGVRDIMLLLANYSVSPECCVKIYHQLGSDAPEKIKHNPYILCNEGIDFPFEKAELIASEYSISGDNISRISAGIRYILRGNLMNGHTCVPRGKLTDVAVRLLSCGRQTISDVCDTGIAEMWLSCVSVGETDYIGLPVYISAEEHIAARLSGIRQHIGGAVKVDSLEIEYVENKLGIKFAELQKQAICSAFDSGMLILTGGPGTGKTTTLNAIISLFEKRDLIIELAAPTGRAAKRMTELTGREAKTLHRLLEVEWGENEEQSFSRNEKNPLNCDVVIVDEASMIDTLLFDSLLKATRLSCRIILVGDADQLPSISAGNVLNDILSSEMFPSIRLEKVFRQASKSQIVTTAHAIIKNERVELDRKDGDMFFIRRTDPYGLIKTVTELVCERLPKAYGFDSVADIQLLCPSRKAQTGTVNLNNYMQEALNPRKDGDPQLSFKGFYLREGDKVMQIKNNYDLVWLRSDGTEGTGVFNGDIGFITKIDPRAGMVKVRFDDRIATYFADEIGQLELSYAVTVHKSQGSEFDCVILPLLDVPSQLKYRNLLYTAVTRAKRLLILVGSENVFYDMAENDRKTLRYTLLKEFLIRNGSIQDEL